MTSRLRIAIIASARFPIREPFAGGLEAQTWSLADGLRRRGHQVTLFAGPTADPRLHVAAVDSLAEHGSRRFDVIHNNSLHHLPVAMARALDVPVVTTLHTPPTPWLESAIQVGRCPVTFVAVSAHTAAAWSHAVPNAQVVRNGVDLRLWRAGPGGGPLVWFGRLVPEKGAHLAIRAARLARLPLDIVGPKSDPTYFRDVIAPLLGDRIFYRGHLEHQQLAALVGRASAALLTPCWDEPYGLVAAESLACGTPVAGFERGALPEVVDPASGILVEPGDVGALADAARCASLLSRASARQRAEHSCSVETMLDGYENLYSGLAEQAAA
jgi:glycosyltransferase involved in cell wall biosynthesis